MHGSGKLWWVWLLLLSFAIPLYGEEEKKIVWHDISEEGFQLQGLYWYNQHHKFRRLPEELNPPVYWLVSELADDPAGAQIRFRSNSGTVWVEVELGKLTPMNHMTLRGSSGVDLYAGLPWQERFVTSMGPGNWSGTTFSGQLFPWSDGALREAKMRSFIINLPLYNPLQSIKIGLEEGAEILPPPAYDDPRPIVIYGTSITQGGCASRPGSALSNILSRRLRREVLNFGFSGCGGGEVALAHHLAQIKDPALYIFDCEANAGGSTAKNEEECIAEIRKYHPAVPILLVSGVPYSFETMDQPRSEEISSRDAKWSSYAREQEALVARLRANGDENIYFLDSSEIWDKLYSDEMTVDGAHPTDYGFYLMAEPWEETIRQILALPQK